MNLKIPKESAVIYKVQFSSSDKKIPLTSISLNNLKEYRNTLKMECINIQLATSMILIKL